MTLLPAKKPPGEIWAAIKLYEGDVLAGRDNEVYIPAIIHSRNGRHRVSHIHPPVDVGTTQCRLASSYVKCAAREKKNQRDQMRWSRLREP